MTDNADRYDPLAGAEPEAWLAIPEPDRDYSIPGDLVLIYPEGVSPRLIVRTPRVRADWGAAQDRDPWDEPAAPAVAIEYRGEFYRVSSVGEHGSAVEYRLDSWPEGEALRRTETYSRSSEIRRRLSEDHFAAALRIARLLTPLYPVIGMLPAEMQIGLAARMPIAIGRAVVASAVLETAVGGYMLFFGTVVRWIGDLVGADDVLLPSRLLGLPSSVWVALAPLLLMSGLWRLYRFHAAGAISGNLLLEGLVRLIPHG
jgi:hypothetical protein